MKIGILALQGDVEEHRYALEKAAAELGAAAEVVEVKKAQDLGEVSALLLTGGESTTIGKLAKAKGLEDGVKKAALPILATCAGLIYLAKEAVDKRVGKTKQSLLGLLDVSVVRNAFGRQRESFQTELEVKGFGKVNAVFIRAPAVVKIGPSVEPLASLRHADYGEVYVAVRQGSILATAFHPELTTTAFHKWLIREAKR